METSKLKIRLSNLEKTINFETVATQVFNRLIHGQGPGLLVLYGPDIKANKTYFMDVVEAFQQGCPPIAKDFVSSELWSLLSRLHTDMYQCINLVNVIKEFDLEPGATSSYRIPLGVTISVALAITAQASGLEKGGKVVILCDDLPKFLEYNTEANEQFLIELSRVLSNRKEMTFLAAARLKEASPYWDAPALLGSEHVLNLGWD